MFTQAAGDGTVSRTAGRNASTYDLVNPGGRSVLPDFFRGLRNLNIRDMDPDECTYNQGKITLEIIEDAESFLRVMLMAQDKRGDVVYVAFYNDSPKPSDDLLQEKVGYGTTITLANPLMKIALDGRTMIRVEEDDELFIHSSKDIKKCRFCSKPNAEQKCARCKRAHYCSRECQTHDWQLLKHKQVCDAYKWINSRMS